MVHDQYEEEQRKKDGLGPKDRTRKYPYSASLNYWQAMAHYVGKLLGIRPGEIMDTWCCAELCVAYGEYANEVTIQNYEEWKNLDPKTRRKIDHPEQYHVRFYDKDDVSGKV